MLYPKTFYCKIADPSCTIPIKVDIQKCKTVSDLKKQISVDFLVSESDVQINSSNGDCNLAEIPPYSEFPVKILHRCYNIDFILPDDSRIKIPNSYRMTIGDLFQFFDTNQLHFSTGTKRTIQFTVSSQKVPNINYPFLSIPNLTPVYIKMQYKPVVIKYGDKKFIFSENESVSEAINEIKTTFQSCSFVLLRDIEGHQANFWVKLQSDVDYDVLVVFEISFHSIDDSFTFKKKISFLSTVNDLKSKIAKEISKSGNFVDKKEIIIYDSNKKIIFDTSATLSSVKNINTFYFDIENKSKLSNSKSIRSRSNHSYNSSTYSDYKSYTNNDYNSNYSKNDYNSNYSYNDYYSNHKNYSYSNYYSNYTNYSYNDYYSDT